MKVQDLLSSKGEDVVTVEPGDSIATAIERLKQKGIGAMVVSESGSDLAGILSERDVVRGLAVHGDKLLAMRVSDFMTKDVKTCSPDDKINDVMGVMTRSRIRHLPVAVDGKLTGIISIGDVVKHRLEEREAETHVLRDYIVGRA